MDKYKIEFLRFKKKNVIGCGILIAAVILFACYSGSIIANQEQQIIDLEAKVFQYKQDAAFCLYQHTVEDE